MIGKLGNGIMVIFGVFREDTWVLQANRALPFMYMAHEPHMPIRQENLKDRDLSR